MLQAELIKVLNQLKFEKTPKEIDSILIELSDMKFTNRIKKKIGPPVDILLPNIPRYSSSLRNIGPFG